MGNKEYFDEDYYERGVSTGKSMYENYKWVPHIAFERACTLKTLYPNVKSVLDFGCAKGYVVYVLRLLGLDAYGYDISTYALDNCRPAVIPYIIRNRSEIRPKFDLVYGKDVLEHIPENEINEEVYFLSSISKQAFFIVPFGDNGKYRISEYHKDKSHVIIKDEEWWAKLFLWHGFIIRGMSYNIPGFKDKWIAVNRYGNGFYFLESKR